MTTLDDLDGLIKLALAEGALAAELLLTERTVNKVARVGVTSPTVTTETHNVLDVRVWVKGGRVGRMRGAPANGADLVGQALASTFETAEDSFAGPVGRLPGPSAGLSIRDRRYDRLDAEARVGVVDDLRNQCKAERRFSLDPIHYEDTLTRRALVNSKGVSLEEEGTAFRIEATLTGKGLTLRQHTASRSFSSVASLPLGTNLVKRANELLRTGKVLPDGPVRVVLPPLPMSRLLDVLGERFHPTLVASGSFLSSARPSLSPKLHVVDDGALPSGLRSRSFDDRGVPPVPLTVLKEGEVAARFLDPERARQLGTRPTGHCVGDGLRAGNLVMREGTRSINALLTEHGGPSLMLDDLPDLSSLNLETGELDLRVNGVVMQANKAVGAMVDVRITGNLEHLLSQIVEVCNNTDRIGHIDAASIIADGLVLST